MSPEQASTLVLVSRGRACRLLTLLSMTPLFGPKLVSYVLNVETTSCTESPSQNDLPSGTVRTEGWRSVLKADLDGNGAEDAVFLQGGSLVVALSSASNSSYPTRFGSFPVSGSGGVLHHVALHPWHGLAPWLQGPQGITSAVICGLLAALSQVEQCRIVKPHPLVSADNCDKPESFPSDVQHVRGWESGWLSRHCCHWGYPTAFLPSTDYQGHCPVLYVSYYCSPCLPSFICLLGPPTTLSFAPAGVSPLNFCVVCLWTLSRQAHRVRAICMAFDGQPADCWQLLGGSCGGGDGCWGWMQRLVGTCEFVSHSCCLKLGAHNQEAALLSCPSSMRVAFVLSRNP
jgi:hypothetical protein